MSRKNIEMKFCSTFDGLDWIDLETAAWGS